MGGCQNYGPFLGTLSIRCRTIPGTQKGTIILTTTHMERRREAKFGERTPIFGDAAHWQVACKRGDLEIRVRVF